MLQDHNTRTIVDLASSIKDKYLLLDLNNNQFIIVDIVEETGKYSGLITYTKQDIINSAYTLKEAKHLIGLITGRYGASGIHKEYPIQIMLVKLESWYETLINPIVSKLGADGNPL